MNKRTSPDIIIIYTYPTTKYTFTELADRITGCRALGKKYITAGCTPLGILGQRTICRLGIKDGITLPAMDLYSLDGETALTPSEVADFFSRHNHCLGFKLFGKAIDIDECINMGLGVYILGGKESCSSENPETTK